MKNFIPDYQHIVNAARNLESDMLPLYEHIIAPEKMEEITGVHFASLADGNESDIEEYFRHYCAFFKNMGYDTVSYEALITSVMPGSGALYSNKEGVIKDRSDFNRYEWDEIPLRFVEANRKYYTALQKVMPKGMKAVGGVGNGVFECIQDVVGYQNLCYISADDPALYEDLFSVAGRMCQSIWKMVIKEFGDLFCLFRFGDDLGFQTGTLLSTDDIRQLIIPQYVNIIDTVHKSGKPFLLHSCGKIFDVMEDLIEVAKIDAKHSNEDQIAPFPLWVDMYGDRIGNFGGIDTDAVCRLNRAEMKEYIVDVVKLSSGRGGFAFGSGNSIPDYVPAEGYCNMVEIVREIRGR